MDITSMSLVELKALKSDVYETIAQQQQNLAVLNQEIVKRQETKEEPKEELKENE